MGFCGFAYFQAAIFQRYERWRVEKTFASSTQRTNSFEGVQRSARKFLSAGTSIGWVEVPRLGLSVVLVEGVSRRDLRLARLAVGHIPGTALPNESGNVGIAGHRDTFFRDLRRIRPHDLIIVRTSAGLREYSVEWTRIVKPSSVDVLAASAHPELTLVTCYPFYYLGPQRFIVRAHLVDTLLQSPD
jgi:sortase A